MSKVTSKLQVTIPKAIAEQYGIKPGDEIDWEPAGKAIRVIPARPLRLQRSREEVIADRLRAFHAAEERQRAREAAHPLPLAPPGANRGWTREDLYLDDRGLPRGYPRGLSD